MAWLLLAEVGRASSVDAVGPTVQWFNVISNAGAFGLLVVIVTWLGPKLFREWSKAHAEVGEKLDSAIARVLKDQAEREERARSAESDRSARSRADYTSWFQTEKATFEKREERILQTMEKGLTAVHQALAQVTAGQQSQTQALASLREALSALPRRGDKPT